MPVNQYIKGNTSTPDQNLLEDLFVESIKSHGIDVYYLPRTIVSKDDILNEIDSESFNSAYLTEVYLKSIDNFEGDGSFLAKFHLEVRDQITLTISNRAFANNVGEAAELTRPREGDVIYIPMIGTAYWIKNADKAPMPYYQLGRLKSYDLTCELVEYSHETFNTGIAEIDDKYDKYDGDITDILNDNNGEIPDSYDINDTDIAASNDDIQNEAKTLIDFSERNPLSKDTY